MNPFHGDTATSENTSSTSCLYTSESDRLYLRQLRAQRSRINKLFRENYIPSREIKLIDKLVKTRALYDDVRNQLISGSSISVNEKAVLKPIKFTPAMGKELEDAEKGSDIFTMIDLVDKGVVLGPRKLSQCCSCCSCNARTRFHEHAKKSRRQKGTYTGGCTTSNSSRISTDVSNNNLGFETKNIKSEPCTCTSKLEQLKKRKSKSLLAKNLPMQKLSINEPSFLGFFPIDEHRIQSNKKLHHTSKRSEVYGIKNAEGKIVEPMLKLPQSRSNRRRCVDTLETIQNRKAVKNLDKDIQSRLNKSLLSTVEHFLMQNIPTDNISHAKKHSVTKFKNISPKKLNRKTRQDIIEHNPSQYLTEKWLKLELDKAKMKHLYDTKNIQGALNAYNVSIEAKPNYDAMPLNDRKYRIVTRRRKNPTNREKSQPCVQSKTDLQLSNPTIKNTQSSRKEHQFHIQNSTYPIHDSCLCTFKLKPKKCMSKKDIVTQETTLSKHSCDVRISSNSNITFIQKLKQYPTKNNYTSTTDADDFGVNIESEHSITKNATILKYDKDVVPEFQTSNLIKIEIDNNCHESVHITKSVNSSTKRVHIGTDKERNIRYKLSQVSSTAISRQTVIKHKLQRCLCKLKLIKPRNKKTKHMIRARNKPHSDSKYLHGSDSQRSHTPLKTYSNELLHEAEVDRICDDECIRESKPAIKPKHKIRNMLSSLTSHKSEDSLRISPLRLPNEGKSLFNNFPYQTDSGTKLIQKLDEEHLKEHSSLDPDDHKPFEHRNQIKFHEEKCSVTKIVQEDADQKYKFAMIKIEKEENSLLLGPTTKRCLCTMKLQKKGKNAINHNPASVGTETHINTGNTYPDLQKIKKYQSKVLKNKQPKTLTPDVNIPNENYRSKSIKPSVQERMIATENKQISRKSQVKIKTCDKTFGVTPKLKRCFCTLQLFKNNKQKKVNMCACVKAKSYLNYNVITPEINLPNKNQLFFNSNHAENTQNLANQWCHLNENSSSSMFSVSTIEFNSKTMQSYFQKSEFKLLRLDADTANLSSQKILRFKSKLSFELNNLKNIYVMEGNDVDSYYNSLSRRKDRKYRDNPKCASSDLTGIRPLLRRCYCAMNIHVANRGQTHPYKLKPYECEPGVCVPYECDAIECQKLIMKRLKKHTSTMSGTRTDLKSSSSSTAVAGAKAKNMQSSPEHETKRKPKNVVHESPPRREIFQSSGKQAVRLGSTFNFDIEFSKNSGPRKSARKERRPSTSSRSSRTTDRRLRTEGTGSGRHKRHDIESQSTIMKMRDRASAMGPMMKRCFCTLKLQKKGRQQQRPLDMNVKGTSTPPNTRIVPVAMEASQNTKPVKPPKMPKLLPYECEPGVCVPGQCDPHACLELINKRLKKHKGTDSMRSNITSSSSMTASRKMKSKGKRVQSHKKIRAQPTTTHVMKPKPEKISVQPSRQAVRIGSNFSFNIDFFKENSTGGTTAHGPEPESYASAKSPKKVPRCVTCDVCPPDKDKKVQGGRASRDMDSQIVAKKMQSTMTGVSPFLKRCFCTLKLQKSENVKAPVEHKDMATKTQKNRDKPKIDAVDIGTRTKKAQIQERKLEPYECEPGVCIPGECDPHECLKRIKKREMRSKHAGTETHKGHSVSSLVSQSSKPRTRKSQAAHKARKTSHGDVHSVSRAHKQRQRSSYSTSPPRQAVRIGSNFSFNIEFYKDHSPQSPCSPVCVPECEPVCKSVCKPVCPKRTNYKTTETKSMTGTSVSTYSGADRRDSHAHSQLKTESRGSGVGPALKRCFCTLKLQKMGSQQQKAKKTIDKVPKDISTSTKKNKKPEIAVTGKEVSTKTKKAKVTHNLEPYECEPGICIPGQCDPHECLKRIKQRQTRNLGTETTSPGKKTTSSVTSRDKKNKSKKTQQQKEKEKKAKKQDTCLCPEPPKRPTLAHSQAVEDINRQVVRIGSNFSFNIEFYKDRNGSPSHSLSHSPSQSPSQRPQRNKPLTVSSTGCNDIKCKNKACSNLGKKYHHTQSQAASVNTDSKGSGMAPLLKRCFCTLALQKGSTQQTTKEEKIKVKKEKPKIATYDKTTSTKKKYVPPVKLMDLEPYECEPGVCVPGMCDPYECLERIKKRGITRQSQTKEAVGKSKKLQSNIKGPRKLDSQNEAKALEAQHKPVFVEQPRFPLLLDRNNRQVVRISSNFSFNIEFFKDVSHPTPADNDRNQTEFHGSQKNKCAKKCDKPCAVQTGPNKIKCEKKCGKCDDLRSFQSQSDTPQTENKSSGVGKVLKRCFCTAKLNKQGPKTVTVGRVENIGPSFPYLRQDYWVQYQTHQKISKQPNEVNLNQSICQHCKALTDTKIKSKKLLDKVKSKKGICQHCQALSDPKIMKSKAKDKAEMKTILPYSPGKFNKKNSNSIIPNNISSDKECTQISCLGNNLSQVSKNKDVLKKPNLKGARRLTVKKSTSDIIDERIQPKLPKSPIKAFVCRCLQIFSKRKNNPSSNQCFAKSDAEGNPASFKSDGLNPSKSERHSKVNDANTSPKKSKSLKVTKVSDNKKEDEKKTEFSEFQSGDNDQIQKAKQIDCPRCQASHNESNKLPTKLVHFSPDKKNKDVPKQDTKKPQKKNVNNTPCIAICPCCGGFKITKVDPKSNSTGVPHCPNLPDQSSENQDTKKSCSCVGKCACPKLKPACRCVGRCLCTKLNDTPKIDIKNKFSGEKCVCGSPECSKEAEKLKREFSRQRKAKPSKPCVCGSKICGVEKEKSLRHSKDHTCKCESSLEMIKKKKLANKQKKLRAKEKLEADKKKQYATQKVAKEVAKKKYKAFVERQARYKTEDAVRKKKRIEIDKNMLNDVKKYKHSGDTMLITESALDIAKLGFVSAGDIVRSVGKAAIDPKFTYDNIKTTITDPSRAWTKLKSAAEDSPGISTMKRVQLRMNETSCVKKGKETLEQYPVTHYMLHMADKNPKNRLMKRPNKNKRVKIDFQCSPYMLSLRKKPHLSVYLCCPWFYPHCISLLNIWRQFTDVLLFLLAVAVWSPCIFCMEACRALMCCFLCTG